MLSSTWNYETFGFINGIICNWRRGSSRNNSVRASSPKREIIWIIIWKKLQLAVQLNN